MIPQNVIRLYGTITLDSSLRIFTVTIMKGVLIVVSQSANNNNNNNSNDNSNKQTMGFKMINRVCNYLIPKKRIVLTQQLKLIKLTP